MKTRRSSNPPVGGKMKGTKRFRGTGVFPRASGKKFNPSQRMGVIWKEENGKTQTYKIT